MPLFTFLSGAECGNPAAIVIYGVPFKVGATVVVDDPFVVHKLRGNRFFQEVMVDGVPVEPAPVQPVARPRGRPRKQ
jgi:hypothetical protein